MKTPGFDKYNPNSGPTKDNVLTYRFSRTDRWFNLKDKNNYIPGVGSYKFEAKLGDDALKYSIPKPHTNTSKLKQLDDQSVSSLPGPTSYQNTKDPVLYRASTYKIGKEPRFKSQKNVAPDPGAYDPQLLESKRKIFMTKQKREVFKTNNNPGPGQYRIPCSLFDFPNFAVSNGFDPKFRRI